MFRGLPQLRTVIAVTHLGLRALLVLCLSFGAFSDASRLFAQDSVTAEYLAKANYIANFPNFVEWPSDPSRPGKFTFLVCVFGDYPFGTSLAESMRGATVDGRRTEVRWVRKPQELSSCQILFVSHSERKRYAQTLDVVRDLTVLTIGETPDFLEAGGILTFTFRDGKILFDVNLDAANKSHLKLSSRLLALARYVLNPT